MPRPSPPSSTPPPEGPRLSKRMSELGLASRREADEWIEQGWVSVDGQIVSELGIRVSPTAHIEVLPQAQRQQAQSVTILLNKPLGYVSGQPEDGHRPAVELITPENQWTGDRNPQRLQRPNLRHLAPAGRLDLDSTGLLVFTQDGRIARHLIGQDTEIEKEYLVRVTWNDKPDCANLAAAFPKSSLEKLCHGLSLEGKQLKPAKVSWQNEQQLRFALREGRKRQIRRMCEMVGLQVTALKRIRIGKVNLSDMPPGQWRFLRPHETF